MIFDYQQLFDLSHASHNIDFGRFPSAHFEDIFKINSPIFSRNITERLTWPKIKPAVPEMCLTGFLYSTAFAFRCRIQFRRSRTFTTTTSSCAVAQAVRCATMPCSSNLIRNFLDVGQYMTTITLDHTFYTGLVHQNYPHPIPFETTTLRPQPPRTQPYDPNFHVFPPQPETNFNQNPWTNQRTTVKPVQPNQWPSVTATPSTATQQTPYWENNSGNSIEQNFECGVPDYRPRTHTPLVYRGKEADRGQFPW